MGKFYWLTAGLGRPLIPDGIRPVNSYDPIKTKNEFSEGVIRSTNWVNIPHYEIRKWIKSTSDKVTMLRVQRTSPGSSLRL